MKKKRKKKKKKTKKKKKKKTKLEGNRDVLVSYPFHTPVSHLLVIPL